MTVLATQHGVIARWQARRCGVSDSTIRGHLMCGRWQPVYRGIYATFTGPLPRAAKLWAVLLRAGVDAALSHATAAEIAGLVDPVPSGPIHVTVPERRRMARLPGVRIHVADRVRNTVHPSRLPPQTRIEETVLDMGQIARSPADAAAYVMIACGRRLTTPDRIRAAIERRPRLRWRAALLEACANSAEGCQSLLETRFLRTVERAHGLPGGLRQHRVRAATGTTYDDVLYVTFGVVVELDGRRHTEIDARRRDAARDNESTMRGFAVLRYDWAAVTFNPCRVAAEVAAVLRSRGWTGNLTTCARCRGIQQPRDRTKRT